MSTSTSPTMKRVRRLGEDFAVSGDRAVAAKYVKLHRKQPPGMHGKKRAFARTTGYGQQLLEKQKVRAFYGLTERQLHKYYVASRRQTGKQDVALLVALEARLDNVVYRAGLTDSHPAARQLVGHGHFRLNGRRVDIPSISVRAGDAVEFADRSNSLKQTLQDTAKANKPASWLKVDGTALTVTVTSLPTRDEIEVPFNEKLIIEFYSR